MSKCRICQNTVEQFGSGKDYCPNCGARYKYISHAKQSILERLKAFIKESLRSETEKEAKKYVDEGFNAVRFGYEACIPYHEKAARLNPKYESVLATTYLGAADERLGITGGGGLLRALERSLGGEETANKILNCVKKLRESIQIDYSQYYEAYDELDKMFKGALSLYDKAIEVSNHSTVYTGRAQAFHEVADSILRAYGVFHHHANVYTTYKEDGNPYSCGKVQLGTYSIYRKEMPKIESIAEILWLFERAAGDYRDALKIDHTSTKSYFGLYCTLSHLGENTEAVENLHKALSILNKAIKADKEDEVSYKERIAVFEELGETKLEISDLERFLALSTDKFMVEYTKEKLASLRASLTT